MAKEKQIQAFAQSLRRLGVLYAQIASEQSSAHDMFSKPELLTIDVLGVRGSCRMGEIAKHLGVVQSAITALIDRLEDRDIVERVRSKEDRRVWLVTLTKQGQKIYANEEKVYRAVANEMLAPLDEAEQDLLISLMDRIGTTETST